jgi:hypothetical protein
MTGIDSGIAYQPLPIDDPSKRKPEIAKAQRLLGWSATTALHDGLERVLEHYRSCLISSELGPLASDLPVNEHGLHAER